MFNEVAVACQSPTFSLRLIQKLKGMFQFIKSSASRLCTSYIDALISDVTKHTKKKLLKAKDYKFLLNKRFPMNIDI